MSAVWTRSKQKSMLRLSNLMYSGSWKAPIFPQITKTKKCALVFHSYFKNAATNSQTLTQKRFSGLKFSARPRPSRREGFLLLRLSVKSPPWSPSRFDPAVVFSH